MPYDWLDGHRGNIPQTSSEDAAATDEEKAIAEERSRSLRVPGVKPGMLMNEKDAARGLAPTDPRGLVFDDKTGALRPISDDDYTPSGKAKATADKPATEKQQDAMEERAADRRLSDRK